MGWIHPIALTLGALASLYVLYLGGVRFCCNHLSLRAPFAWKLHVRIGSAVLALWTLGALQGLWTARFLWGDFFLSGEHGRMGVGVAFGALAAYCTGQFMNREKKRRVFLPIIHGGIGFILVLLALRQILTGLLLTGLL